MSKSRTAVKDKMEFVNFQVNLMLLFINIMGPGGEVFKILQNTF